MAAGGSVVSSLFTFGKNLISSCARVRDITSFVQNGGPVFFHAPRGQPKNGVTKETAYDFRVLAKCILNRKRTFRYDHDSRLKFVTYSNYDRKTLIEKCYDKYGVPYVVVARDVKQWSWIDKIKPVLDLLESKNDAEYLVVTDANDVLLVNNPDLILKRFEDYNCNILFCNTVADWPENKCYRDFEMNCYYSHPLHCHLSAGGYIARREPLKEYLNEIVSGFEKREEKFFHKGKFDDQLAWRSLHYKYFPKIKVDYRSLIFKRFDLFRLLDY